MRKRSSNRARRIIYGTNKGSENAHQQPLLLRGRFEGNFPGGLKNILKFIATALGGADLSRILGFPVSALSYWLLTATRPRC